MFAILKLSLLALALPVGTAVASAHANPLANRHHELAKRASGDMHLYKRFDNAKLSWYWTETGNQGSCGTWLKDTAFTVAMNPAQMNSGLCGKQITISWKGKSATATILDTCPVCPYGGLDLSPSLFSFFGDKYEIGIIWDGSWTFTGAAAPAPPAPAPPKSTTTKAPPPATTTKSVVTTSKASSTSTRTSTKISSSASSTTLSSSSTTVASSSASVNYSSGVASGLAVPTGSVDRTAGETLNLEDLTQAFIQMGGLAVAAHSF